MPGNSSSPFDGRAFVPPEKFSFQPRYWIHWKKRWEHYHTLTSLKEKEDAFQISALLYSMGDKADEILSSLRLSDANSKTYVEVFKALDAHFIGKRNVVFERATFWSRSQEVGEPIETYVTALHTLSEFCEYGNLRKDLVCDRIVLGVRDKKLSEKLMFMETLTLEKAIEVAKQWERVKQEQETLKGEEKPAAALDIVSKKKKGKGKKKSPGSGVQPKSGKDSGKVTPKSSTSGRECKFCGGSHPFERGKCPASGQTCRKCGELNHFAKKCLSGTKTSTDRVKSSEDFFQIGTISEVNGVCSGDRISRWRSEIVINGHIISFKLDIGADCTAVPYLVFRKLWPKKQILPPARILNGPNGNKLPVVGYVSSQLKAKDVIIKEDVYVVKYLEYPLLSVRACEDLNLVQRIGAVKSGTSVKPLKEFPELFTGLGKLEDN